jgi:hypothetical protein
MCIDLYLPKVLSEQTKFFRYTQETMGRKMSHIGPYSLPYSKYAENLISSVESFKIFREGRESRKLGRQNTHIVAISTQNIWE